MDHSDGHILMKKKESWLNTFSYPLTYLLRCNTDITSLLLGMSIKAIISYVTDYVTKPTLKTHQVFSSAYDVYEKNSDLIGADKNTVDSARKLMLKITNLLTAKMEISSPLASLYLLENPDHYTSHEFPLCWWRNYVSEIMQEASTHIHEGNNDERKDSNMDGSDSDEDEDLYNGSDSGYDNECVKHVMEVDSDDESVIGNLDGGGMENFSDEEEETSKESDDKQNGGDNNVVLGLEDGKYIPKSYIDDYRFRPVNYESYTLFQWIQCHNIKKRSKQHIKTFKECIEKGENLQSNKSVK